jgi:hypothetical protein
MTPTQPRLLVMLFAIPFATLAVPTLNASAQPPNDAVLVFHFERPALPVPVYTFTLHQDGTGTYAASYASSVPTSKFAPQYPTAQAAPPVETTRPISLSPKTTALLFERVRSTDQFHTGCESKLKNIADTGAKTINYTGPEGSAHCTFNYTENKNIAAVSETFQAIAQTLDEGRTIDLKHRYDRLGLDQELALLADQVKEGRALEVATIAPVLQSLCDDTQVMDRVRKRAAGLLQASANAR